MTRGRAIAAGVVGLLALAGCGSNDDSGDAIVVVASETKEDSFAEVGYALDGDDVTLEAPTIEVPVGEEVTIVLENRTGQYSPTTGSHDFAVIAESDDLFTDIATGKVADLVLWGAATPILITDESATITFTPDEPGTYTYLCTIPGHAKSGMIGEFVVTA